jgi:hypothetical protein
VRRNKTVANGEIKRKWKARLALAAFVTVALSAAVLTCAGLLLYSAGL